MQVTLRHSLAHFPEQRLVIEPNRSIDNFKTVTWKSWLFYILKKNGHWTDFAMDDLSKYTEDKTDNISLSDMIDKGMNDKDKP